MPNTTWTLLTAGSQGAIAILQLTGEVEDALRTLTGKASWRGGALHLVEIPDIDEVIAVKLHDTLAQIMPHGGLQVIRKIAERFADMHIEQTFTPCYPEAKDAIEEAMLIALSVAKSPLAVDLLLQQPKKLRGVTATSEDLARSRRLNLLITPPKVVLLGAPNTGKSTLMNALTRQDTSIVHDLPGATRDAVGSRVNCAGLVVDLYDLPGFRTSVDTIEQDAIALATVIANEASLTILIADAEHEWIKTTANNTLRIGTKADLALRSDATLCVSVFADEGMLVDDGTLAEEGVFTGKNILADDDIIVDDGRLAEEGVFTGKSTHTCKGMEQVSLAIRDALVPPADLKSERPWFFEGYTPIEE